MTTKEYLWQIKDMRKRIKEKQSELAHLRGMLTNISVSTDGERVQTSSDPDKIGSTMAEIIDRESELIEMINSYAKKEKEISDQIDSMKDSKYREILHWRYVECMTFENIAACVMEISFMHTFRLHGQALQEFEKEFGQCYKML